MVPDKEHLFAYQWRSSKWFIISCVAIALFSENFLCSFIVPILHVMLEDRLGVGTSQTQLATTFVLSLHAFVAMLSGPLIGYLADKSPNRKYSLLLSLGAELAGTIVIMCSPSVPILLFGRAIQAIGGNAAWIVGLATVSDTVGQDNIGRTLGALSSLFASGLLLGPVVSGVLLRLVGYWSTWMAAVLLLAVDMGMRAVMIENKHVNEVPRKAVSIDESTQESNANDADEQTALLYAPPYSKDDQVPAEPPPSDVIKSPLLRATSISESTLSESMPPSENIYKFLLTKPRALTALACHSIHAVVMTSLDTTLPLHVVRKFGWDTPRISLMFLVLLLPSLVSATFLGMLKDRHGVRLPTGFGLVSMAVSIVVLGAGSNHALAHTSEALTIVSIAGIGIARAFISGSGILEITNVMNEARTEQPTRFGPNGKMSSAYSMTNFAWNAGLLLGPVISGPLVRTIGYYYMNLVIAIMTCIIGFLALAFLGKRKPRLHV